VTLLWYGFFCTLIIPCHYDFFSIFWCPISFYHAPYKQNCTKAKGNKTLAISHKFKELRTESLENITTEFGKQLRMNRSIQAEGVFGVLKQDYGFRRFLCRSKNNIRTEFLLLELAYNIKKLFAKISENRLGISLFELKTA